MFLLQNFAPIDIKHILTLQTTTIPIKKNQINIPAKALSYIL